MKVPKVVYKGKPGKNSWCRWAVNRVKKLNDSTNIRITGDTGAGKTYSGIAMAEIMAKMLGRKFTIDDIYFSNLEVINHIQRDDPKPCSIFLIDEGQIVASHKEHFSARNKAFAFLMSTVRHRRFIFIFTLPFADMLDKQVRRLFHVEVEAEGVDHHNQVVKSKPRYLEHSRTGSNKVYTKRLVVVYKDEKTGITRSKRVDLWDIPKPSKELIEAYEIKKKAFTDKLYSGIANILGKYEDSGALKEVIKVEQPISEEDKIVDKKSSEPPINISERQYDILSLWKQGIFRHYKIAEILKCSRPSITKSIRGMRKKGYLIEEYRDKFKNLVGIRG